MTPVEPPRTRRAGWLLIACAALGAFLLYRPHTAAPFEIVDFSETLPILTAGDGFLERFRGLFQYYVGHGRAAIGLSAGLAAKWTLFEWWTPGWQWTRYLVGLGVVVLAWNLLRRLGASRAGAAAGASLFIVAEAAAPGWLRPAVSEPFGTVLLLTASLVACRYQSTARPLRMAVVVAALCMLLIATKETLIATMILPVGLALCLDTNGLLTWPRGTRRNIAMLTIVGVGAVIASLPTLWAVTQTTAEGYAQQFGSAESLVGNAIFGVLPVFVPFMPPVAPAPGWLLALMVFAWLAVLILGWRTVPVGSGPRRHALIALLLALLLAAARVVVYLPWPLDYPYYSFPYLLAAALLVGLALTHLRSAPRSVHSVAWIATLATIGFSVIGADAQTSRQFAARRLTHALITEFHTLDRSPTVDRLVVAVPSMAQQQWWGLGPTLARYADATGRPLPATSDTLCQSVAAAPTQPPPGTGIVALRWQCELPALSRRTVRAEMRRFDLGRMRVVIDTLHADIILPDSISPPLQSSARSR